MKTNIAKIIGQIEKLNENLKAEYNRLAKKYGFTVHQGKVVFLAKFKKRNRQFKVPVWQDVLSQSIRHLFSLTFIYMMIIPAVILDIFISVYHFVAFPLYGIPKVKRKDFIVYDRRFLDYLNVMQKVHCLYCSYVNGLFAYSMEIAARTERYWCPIKAASKPRVNHGWYNEFADYGNPEEWREKVNDQNAFEKLTKSEKNRVKNKGICKDRQI